MKMRATLKLDNEGAAHNAVARKSISSSQCSNPLTVISLLDGAGSQERSPSHGSREGVIAIGTNLELF
jgi:hypothetical protein